MSGKKKKKFKRENSHKKAQTPESWRRPKGGHSRIRLEVNGAPAKPKAGYRTDKEIRGLHPSGFEEVMVHNTDDLEDIDPETEAARIGSTVGGRKRAEIIEKADEEEIKVLNGATEEGEEE
jgi:large subunit ribosomal protein L32e